jgi:HPt (histidine-containing phosphotransfer) domain-containing protein
MEADHSQPIDRAYLARVTRNNAALEREVLELFARQLPLYVAQLLSAASAKDWKEAAHAIKGSALAVGAHRLASCALAVERLDFEVEQVAAARREAMEAVGSAAEEVCRYVTCLFATA